jgi:hypothetical protein
MRKKPQPEPFKLPPKLPPGTCETVVIYKGFGSPRIDFKPAPSVPDDDDAESGKKRKRRWLLF